MISFVVPSYNQGRYIRQTLDSIVINMAGDDQLIIADGASTDDTLEVVKPFLTDPRIQCISEADRGYGDAVSKALQLATNPIIGITSSDDLYLPQIRDRVLSEFKNESVGLVYGSWEVIDAAGRFQRERGLRSGSLEDFLSLRIIIPQSSTFFRLSVADVGNCLRPEYDYIADVVLFNHIATKSEVTYVPRVLSRVRRHSGSRTGTQNPGSQYRAAIDRLWRHLNPEVVRKTRAGALLLEARYERQRMRALRLLMHALRLDPLAVNHWLMGRTLAYAILGQRLTIRTRDGLEWANRFLRTNK
jgi:glycosyltransferase involved in cell wall biosynthesis